MDDKEKLWASTARSFDEIADACLGLSDIANQVRYLHPELAKDLYIIRAAIDKSTDTIRGNLAEEVNLDIAAMHKSQGELLKAMLSR
jgi:hypothetical protein